LPLFSCSPAKACLPPPAENAITPDPIVATRRTDSPLSSVQQARRRHFAARDDWVRLAMATAVDLDEADIRILSALQKDGTLSIAALSDVVNLSHNSCWRRLRRLEEAKIISGRVALLDPVRLGLDLTVFVSIRTSEHNEQWLAAFAATATAMPEVIELYRMAGDVDYLMKLRVKSIAAYDAVYKRLIAAVRLTDVSSSFAMEEMKHTTALPLCMPARG
jgi:Lrp/AsnC family transcriptional regulator